jgi:S-formylglutathione hydrolase FrmB
MAPGRFGPGLETSARTVICAADMGRGMPIRVPTEARSEAVFPGPLAGTVESHSFESNVLVGNPWGDPTVRDLPVYVPPSGKTEGLPLLVLLSGYTGSGWMHFTKPPFLRSSIVRRLDHLIQTGAAPEAVLVAPDCVTTLGASQYLNSSATGRYEDYVVREVLPWVQERYRTGPSAVLGTSSGGYGALALALRHPDLLRAAGSNSGDAYFEYCYLPEFPAVVRALRRAGGPEALLRRALSEPTSNFGPTNPTIQAFETMAYASAYSPVRERPGEFELPFDLDTGALREDIWERWLACDPVRMVRTPEYSAAVRKLAYVYVDGGARDEYGLDLGARIFAAEAKAQGGNVEFEEFDGVHGDGVPRYNIMIPRLLRALRPP